MPPKAALNETPTSSHKLGGDCDDNPRSAQRNATIDAGNTREKMSLDSTLEALGGLGRLKERRLRDYEEQVDLEAR
jgi:hypothetical protein